MKAPRDPTTAGPAAGAMGAAEERRSSAAADGALGEPAGGTWPVATPAGARRFAQAEQHLRAAGSMEDALRRFAGVALRLWPTLVHVSVVIAGDGAALHGLVPESDPQPLPAREGSPWEGALLYGEASVLPAARLRAASYADQIALSALGTRPLTALGISPLVAAGRVLGAINLGVATRGGRPPVAGWPVNLGQLNRLERLLAERLVETAPAAHDERVQEKRRQLLARLLHDVQTPLSGIGLVAELLTPGGVELPGDIVEAARVHHADLLRFVGELADYALLDLDARLPQAHPVVLDEVLEVVLWRLWPYMQRRRQQLRVSGRIEQPLMVSQRHLEQALTATVFDLSSCAGEGTNIRVRARQRETHATIQATCKGCTLPPERLGDLTDPYLRARPRDQTMGLMSLAASKVALEHYGGALHVAHHRGSLHITLSVPLA